MQYIPKACPWCHKPFRDGLPFTLQQHGANYIAVPMLNGVPVPPEEMCHGHVLEQCPRCGYDTVMEYHDAQRCRALQAYRAEPKPKLVEVPQVFYDAFDKEKC